MQERSTIKIEKEIYDRLKSLMPDDMNTSQFIDLLLETYEKNLIGNEGENETELVPVFDSEISGRNNNSFTEFPVQYPQIFNWDDAEKMTEPAKSFEEFVVKSLWRIEKYATRCTDLNVAFDHYYTKFERKFWRRFGKKPFVMLAEPDRWEYFLYLGEDANQPFYRKKLGIPSEVTLADIILMQFTDEFVYNTKLNYGDEDIRRDFERANYCFELCGFERRYDIDEIFNKKTAETTRRNYTPSEDNR